MKNPVFISSALFQTIFLAFSITIALLANQYANTFVGPVIADIILDHIPVVDTSFIFYQGAFILFAILLLALFYVPRYVPFVFSSIALFYLIRAGFIVSTHIPAATGHSGNDLFFSGHTGLPFLLGLVFWRYKTLRYFFITASAIAGVSVLLSHVHYTIDVLGAYFITYTIFVLAKKMFKREYDFL